MASPGRYVGKVAPKGLDPDIVARSQGFLPNIASRGMEDIDLDAVQSQAESIASLLETTGYSPQMMDAVARRITAVASGGDAAEFEAYRRALEIVDRRQPGTAGQLFVAAGSPESLANDFAGAATPDLDILSAEVVPGKRGPAALAQNVPILERGSTYGSGTKGPPRVRPLGDLMFENTRSRAERIGGMEKPWQQYLLEYTTAQRRYRDARDLQLKKMAGMALTPEVVADLSPKQIAQLSGIPVEQLTPDVAQGLVGMELTPDAAKALSRPQRDALAGPIHFSDLSEEDAAKMVGRGGGGPFKLSEDLEQMRDVMSTRDQKVAAMMRHAANGTTPVLDDYFRWWGYDWPTSQGGQIVRPGMAPSGDFLARLTRGSLGTWDEVPNWVSLMTPVFDKAVREQAGLPRKAIPYWSNPDAMTAYDFAQLQLPPYRGGAPLIKAEAEGGMPFQQFSDVRLNRSKPGEPLNLGGLLIDDVQSAPDPRQTISTPDEAVPPPPDQPPVTPAQDDFSMYDPRQILAALLA